MNWRMIPSGIERSGGDEKLEEKALGFSENVSITVLDLTIGGVLSPLFGQTGAVTNETRVSISFHCRRSPLVVKATRITRYSWPLTVLDFFVRTLVTSVTEC